MPRLPQHLLTESSSLSLKAKGKSQNLPQGLGLVIWDVSGFYFSTFKNETLLQDSPSLDLATVRIRRKGSEVRAKFKPEWGRAESVHQDENKNNGETALVGIHCVPVATPSSEALSQ
jgi:hypothetical protein